LKTAAANHTLNIDLGTRFCKREKARAKPDTELPAENLPQEMRQNAFEIGKCDPLIDHKPFDLMKHGRVGCVVVVPIDRPGHDDLQRRLAALHRTDLHGRGVRSQ
jgi:hypothetical protein